MDLCSLPFGIAQCLCFSRKYARTVAPISMITALILTTSPDLVCIVRIVLIVNNLSWIKKPAQISSLLDLILWFDMFCSTSGSQYIQKNTPPLWHHLLLDEQRRDLLPAVGNVGSEENTIYYVIVTHQRWVRGPLPCADSSSEVTEVAWCPEWALEPNAAWGCHGDVLKAGRNGTQYDSFIDLGCGRTSPGHPLPKAVGASARRFPAA